MPRLLAVSHQRGDEEGELRLGRCLFRDVVAEQLEEARDKIALYLRLIAKRHRREAGEQFRIAP